MLGDGEYFLHSQNFDGAFQADPEAMQAAVTGLMNPTHWPADLDAEFFLWIPENGTAPRNIGDPSDESGWLAQRDPDGSIPSDLDQLNQLEDGIISNSDAARLPGTPALHSWDRSYAGRIARRPHGTRQSAGIGGLSRSSSH